MAVIISERTKSRKSKVGLDPTNSSCVLEFVAVGSTNDFEVRAAANAMTPITYGGMFRQNFEIEHQGAGVWYVDCEYSFLQPRTPGQSVYSFETSGGTQHVNISKETIETYHWGTGDPPDYKGAIGVNGDSVEGVDITVPVFNFSETHYIPARLVTAAYKLILFYATGKTNNAAWKGLAEGEALFLGAQGSLRGGPNDFWEINYKFAGLPNRNDILIGGDPDRVVTKKGWEYMWTRYQDKVDQNVLVKQPITTYVERLYDSYSFALLGIGV